MGESVNPSVRLGRLDWTGRRWEKLLEVVCTVVSSGPALDLQGCNILNHIARVEKVTHDVIRCMLHGIILARQDVTRRRAPSRPAEIISNERRHRPAEQRWPVTNALILFAKDAPLVSSNTPSFSYEPFKCMWHCRVSYPLVFSNSKVKTLYPMLALLFRSKLVTCFGHDSYFKWEILP